MDAIRSTLANLGMARLALMVGLLVGLVAFFIYILARISEPDMGLLYSNLDLAESGQIVSRLETMGVPVEIRGDGAQILVPMDQVGRLRMMLAEAGLPSGGSVGYEIFDRSDGLGTSSFVQNINQVRALEGELARTIATMKSIAKARVHLVLPKRELFSRERQNASASVFIKTSGGKRLSQGQIQSIRQLVAAAIPGLLVQHVSVVDDFGTLLAKGDGDEQGFNGANSAEDLKSSIERKMVRTLESLLESSLGPNKVRVEVSADINFDKMTENSENYNPEGQVVRSTQTVKDASQDTTTGEGQAETVTAALGEGGAEGGGKTGSSSQKSSETTNYEISKSVKTLVREGGTVNRLSVAVLVDGTYKDGADGAKTYEPRSQADIDQIKKLVQSAVGFQEDRGDKVEVITMKFFVPEKPELEAEEEGFMGFSKHDIMRVVEVLVLGIVGILILLLIVRPIINRILEGSPNGGAGGGSQSFLPPGGGAGGAMLMGGASAPAGAAAPNQMNYNQANVMVPPAAPPGMAAPPPGGGAGASGGGGASAPQLSTGAPGTNLGDVLAQNRGNVNLQGLDTNLGASAQKQVEQIVDRHPEEAANIVRSWMHQDD